MLPPDPALIEEARRRGLIEAPPPEAVPQRQPSPLLLEEAQRRGLIKKPAKSYVPIPALIKPELAPRRKELLSRQDFEALGGSAGGMIGGVTAGLPGALGGGALGASGGSAYYDALRDLSATIKDRPPQEGGVVDQVREMARAGYDDLIWGMGTASVGPILRRVKPLLGKALGVSGTRQKTDLAHALGVKIGPTHVSKRAAVRGMSRVLGVFPFVSTPYRKGQVRVVGQLDDAAADLLNTLAPSSNAYDVGEKLTKAAVRRYSKGNKIASVLYKRFNDLADSLPVKEIVDTASIRDQMAEIAERQGAEAITLQSGEALKGFGGDAVGDYLKQLTDLPERISVRQARGLERELNAILRTAAKEGWDVSRLKGVKGALQQAKDSLDVSQLPPEVGEQVMKAWSDANGFFTELKTAFQTPTARRFGRVDKNIFGKGVFKPGSINQDEVFNTVFRSKSPEALSDLRTLVGDKDFRRAARQYLTDAFEKSRVPAKEGALVEEMFSAAAFEKRLGLNTQEGQAALTEILRGSPVTPKDFQNFLSVAKTATDITIRDPSTFVMRRFVLGAGLAGSIAMGAGQISVPAAVFMSWMARQGAKFLMNPEQLRTMTRVMSDSVPDHQKRILFTRLIRQATTSEPKEDKPTPPKRTPRR